MKKIMVGRHTPSIARSHRVITCLNRDQVDYLDKIGKDAQFSSGMKLSRNQILFAMVNAMRRLSVTGEGIGDVEQFQQRLMEAIGGGE